MLLAVKNLSTLLHTRKGVARAVDGVSYEIARGEIVALVGESGCGKTMSALSLLRLIPEPPAKIAGGEVWFEGRDILKLDGEEMRRVRGRGIAMVFQEPMTSLNPVLTINRQIGEALVEHRGMAAAQAKEESVTLLKAVGIPDPARRLEQYPHQFSGGMRQRVMLAMALSCGPRLIIADEPTTAVDVSIQAQLLELIYGLTQQMAMSVLLITHNLGLVARYASRVNVMYAGRIVEQATADDLYSHPAHPYTEALLRSVPRLDAPRQAKLMAIDGQPPSLLDLPTGCAFRPRCIRAGPRCDEEWPPLRPAADGHSVACHYPE